MACHHEWREKRPGIEECVRCHDQFPCAEKDCGHFDCVAHRDLTRCFYCRKPLDGAQTWARGEVLREADRPYDTFASRRGNTKAAHRPCRDRALLVERAEDERRARIAHGEVTLADVPITQEEAS